MPTHCHVQLIIANIVMHILSISLRENWHITEPESTWEES